MHLLLPGRKVLQLVAEVGDLSAQLFQLAAEGFVAGWHWLGQCLPIFIRATMDRRGTRSTGDASGTRHRPVLAGKHLRLAVAVLGLELLQLPRRIQGVAEDVPATFRRKRNHQPLGPERRQQQAQRGQIGDRVHARDAAAQFPFGLRPRSNNSIITDSSSFSTPSHS